MKLFIITTTQEVFTSTLQKILFDFNLQNFKNLLYKKRKNINFSQFSFFYLFTGYINQVHYNILNHSISKNYKMGNCNNFCNAFDPNSLGKKSEIEHAIESEENFKNKYIDCNPKLGQSLNKNAKKNLYGDKKVSTALSLSNETDDSSCTKKKGQNSPIITVKK